MLAQHPAHQYTQTQSGSHAAQRSIRSTRQPRQLFALVVPRLSPGGGPYDPVGSLHAADGADAARQQPSPTGVGSDIVERCPSPAGPLPVCANPSTVVAGESP